MNFSTFYTQAMRDKNVKTKKGKYKGQPKKDNTRPLRMQGPPYYQAPGKTDAPSSSTYVVGG